MKYHIHLEMYAKAVLFMLPSLFQGDGFGVGGLVRFIKFSYVPCLVIILCILHCLHSVLFKCTLIHMNSISLSLLLI